MNPVPVDDAVGRDLISIILPAYNEEASILPLARAIERTMARCGRPYEILFVDDGSTDGTYQRILEAREHDPNVRAIRLMKNYGQTAALSAGFDHARGRWIITMDADLQNDPEDIPLLLELLEKGYDMVNGWRRDRKDFFLTRRLPSRVANRILSRLTGVQVHDFGCTLKGYRAELIKSLPIYGDMHRYIPALAAAVGARITEVVVRHHPRRFGRSKYGISRTFRVLSDLLVLQMLVRFSARPLHWFGLLSIPVFLITSLVLVVGYIKHTEFFQTGVISFVKSPTIVYPTVAILGFYLAASLLSLGLLCELVNLVSEGGFDTLYRQEPGKERRS
ncbi:MAG: glycosyltransferase family 2 protein [Planctomycetota bacterium]